MSIEVTWIGHASFRIAGREAVVYIDPWKIPFANHDADVVFVSHTHHDHFSPKDIDKVWREGTVVIAPAEAVEQLHEARAVGPEESVTIKDITVETIAAYNVNKQFHPRSNNWCGAVFTIDGKRIYYAGDTDLISEMYGLKDVDLALLPVSGTYTLDAGDAIKACRAVGCAEAIPYHWGDIVGSAADAEWFSKGAPCKVHILKPGQSIVI